MQLNDLVRNTLADILAQEGRDILADAFRCKALLRDYCPEYKAEISALAVAQEERIPFKLLEGEGREPRTVLVPKLVRQLVHDRALDPAASEWAVGAWESALRALPPVQAAPSVPVTPSPLPHVRPVQTHTRRHIHPAAAEPVTSSITPMTGTSGHLEHRELEPIASSTEWSSVWNTGTRNVRLNGSEDEQHGNSDGVVSQSAYEKAPPGRPALALQEGLIQGTGEHSSLVTYSSASVGVLDQRPPVRSGGISHSVPVLFSPKLATFSQLAFRAGWMPIIRGLLLVAFLAWLLALKGTIIVGPFVLYGNLPALPALLLSTGSSFVTFLAGASLLYIAAAPNGAIGTSFMVHSYLLVLTYTPLRLVGLACMLLFPFGHMGLLIISAYQILCAVQSVRAVFSISRGRAYSIAACCLLVNGLAPLIIKG